MNSRLKGEGKLAIDKFKSLSEQISKNEDKS
jgi:hypothetical protein